MRLKMAVFAAMPSASVSTATAVKPGFFSSWRMANLTSFMTQSLHWMDFGRAARRKIACRQRNSVEEKDRKSTRLNSSHLVISYAVLCLKKKKYRDAWFIRDYDTERAFPKGTAPLWSFFSWDARTPGDSNIDFEVAVAPSLAEISMAPVDPLLFSNPPGPLALVGQPVGARRGSPDTQFGGTMVDGTLETN